MKTVDEDGLRPLILEARYDGGVLVSEWLVSINYTLRFLKFRDTYFCSCIVNLCIVNSQNHVGESDTQGIAKTVHCGIQISHLVLYALNRQIVKNTTLSCV